jgi:hypothetical protein
MTLRALYRVYSLLHRSFECEYCGARIGEKCIGASGQRIEACHMVRKMECTAWRRQNPKAYRALRDAIAKNLSSVPAPARGSA